MRVYLSQFKELPVRPLLDDPPLVKDQYTVRLLDGRQTVGDDDRRPTAHQLGHSGLQARLRFAVDVGCGVIPDKQRGIDVQRSGKGDQLALACAEARATTPAAAACGLFIEWSGSE